MFKMKAQWVLICTLIFALITATFAVINVEPVRVNFLFSEAKIPLILVILGSTLLGGLIVLFLGMFRQFKLQRRIRLLEKRLNDQPSAASQALVENTPSDPPAPSREQGQES
jgi:putative membrane protein